MCPHLRSESACGGILGRAAFVQLLRSVRRAQDSGILQTDAWAPTISELDAAAFNDLAKPGYGVRSSIDSTGFNLGQVWPVDVSSISQLCLTDVQKSSRCHQLASKYQSFFC